jgi:hypothetical protein
MVPLVCAFASLRRCSGNALREKLGLTFVTFAFFVANFFLLVAALPR